MADHLTLTAVYEPVEKSGVQVRPPSRRSRPDDRSHPVGPFPVELRGGGIAERHRLLAREAWRSIGREAFSGGRLLHRQLRLRIPLEPHLPTSRTSEASLSLRRSAS
jgi:hypothetical protein